MIKAAFFDIDGTLMSHKSRSVPQSAREAVEKLQAAGILCVAATGRQIQQMNRLPVADIPFDAYITLNGQLILDKDQKVLYGVPISGIAKDILIRMFSNHEIPALLVEEQLTYLNFEDARVVAVQEAISTPTPPLGTYTGKDIYQVCAYLAEGEEVMVQELEGHCVMTRWGFGGLDIIAPGGGKVTGIRWYLDQMGIGPEEVIAFGDAENDRDMLKFAGIGVAMGNATEDVKAVADFVTTDIDDDGIANGLKHFKLI